MSVLKEAICLVSLVLSNQIVLSNQYVLYLHIMGPLLTSKDLGLCPESPNL